MVSITALGKKNETKLEMAEYVGENSSTHTDDDFWIPMGWDTVSLYPIKSFDPRLYIWDHSDCGIECVYYLPHYFMYFPRTNFSRLVSIIKIKLEMTRVRKIELKYWSVAIVLYKMVFRNSMSDFFARNYINFKYIIKSNGISYNVAN